MCTILSMVHADVGLQTTNIEQVIIRVFMRGKSRILENWTGLLMTIVKKKAWSGGDLHLLPTGSEE